MSISILVINDISLIPNFDDITLSKLKDIAMMGDPKSFIMMNLIRKDMYTVQKLRTIHNVVIPISVKVFRKKWFGIVKQLGITYHYKKVNVEYSTLSIEEKEDYLDEQGIEWTLSRLMSNPRNVKLLNTLNTSNLYFVKKFLIHSKFAPILKDIK